MREPTEKHMAFIKRRARVTMIIARNNGLSFEMDDLIAEGFVTYVKARHQYRFAHPSGRNSAFSTYLYQSLGNTYKDMLRNAFRRRRTIQKEVPCHSIRTDRHFTTQENFEAAYEVPVNGHAETELAELTEHYSSMLTNNTDKEVLREMVYPSELTLTIAHMFYMRANHLVRRHVPVGAMKHARAPQVASPEVLARSLRIPIGTAKNAIQRIRRLIRIQQRKD